MEIITKTLYWVSTGLMIPVMILLLIFFLRALMLIGSFYATYVQKLKFNKEFKTVLDKLDDSNVNDIISDDKLNNKLMFSHYLRNILDNKRSSLYREKQLADFEIACQKDLSESQHLSKLGPVLGLMGTLIPMGPALVGLASGDIASMASNMQVAFSTTVIGLLVGAIGFVILSVKKRWFAADMNNLEYITDLLNNK